MLLIGALLVSFMTSHAFEVSCKYDMNVISKFEWPILSKFRQDIVDQATLVSIGRLCKNGNCSQHIVLHTGDRTYLWGSPNMFRLDSHDQTRELEELYGRQLTDVSFGQDFIMILTADQIVWTAGIGTFGQLAQFDERDIGVFRPVQGLPYLHSVQRATAYGIAAGGYHAMALVRDEKQIPRLYSWGHNSKSQELGYASKTVNVIPKDIPLNGAQGMEIYDICCGSDYCAAHLIDYGSIGLVFTWGDSDHIGRPWGDGSPAKVQGIPSGESIVKVVCANFHTLALSHSGKLFGWGDNGWGQILNAKSNSEYATELDVEGVKDVVADERYTLIHRDSSGFQIFGSYGGLKFRFPWEPSCFVFPRDIMIGSDGMPNTNGLVKLGCKA